MISAVVMAGYNNKFAVRKYSKIVAEHYGEKFIETGYKPLREFKAIENGKEVSKPLIQFTLEKLFAYDRVSEIIIVGHQMLLEQRLRKFIDRAPKPCTVINQNTRFKHDVIKHFRIKRRKVKYNSIGGNLIKGYMASSASREDRHALFVASDSPLTSIAFIDDFLEALAAYEQMYGEPLPVDFWSTHAYILCEDCFPPKPGDPFPWGACPVPDWPDGSEDDVYYSVYDHWRQDIFQERIVAFRRWMRDHGYRDRPLFVAKGDRNCEPM